VPKVNKKWRSIASNGLKMRMLFEARDRGDGCLERVNHGGKPELEKRLGI